MATRGSVFRLAPVPVLILKTTVWLALLAACLLAPASTADWPMGWAVLASYAGVVLAAFLIVDHDLLRERAKLAGGEPFDTVLAPISGLLLYPATLVVAGLDHAHGWTASMAPPVTLPLGVKLLGLGVFVTCYAFVLWAMRSNRFFTTVVRFQNDRGHRLVDSGPYAWVRHPGYAGTIAAHLGMALALGSNVANVPVCLGALALIARITPEEKLLAELLDGYGDYQQRVRWRLLPGVW